MRHRTYIQRMAKSPLVTIKSRRRGPVLVCKKCLKRVEGGDKLRRRLKSELKRNGAAQKNRRPRLVLTSCFGICPKRAVVMASANTLRRGEFILLSDAESVEDAAAVLLADEENQGRR
jgi:predicted metal-binding protein